MFDETRARNKLEVNRNYGKKSIEGYLDTVEAHNEEKFIDLSAAYPYGLKVGEEPKRTHYIVINSNKGMAAYNFVIAVICLLSAILIGGLWMKEDGLAGLFAGMGLASGAMSYGYLVRKQPFGTEAPLKLFQIK
jgi:hypothetical protein